MKKALATMLFLSITGYMHSAVFAAELLDVKPVVTGSAVSVEISADIAMTYTYYKIPGQARAAVDIAEADPEKVDPLIVVNKGPVSSISVDKAVISGIVTSRIIFNLVSESEIFVTASADRKLLTVTFGGTTKAAPKPEPRPELKPVIPSEPVAKVEPPATVTAKPLAGSPADADPLGLDEPAVKPGTAKTATILGTDISQAPTVLRIPKLEPIAPVPVVAAPAPAEAPTPAPASSLPLLINKISTGASFIEIQANQAVPVYKVLELKEPARLVIDIASNKTSQKSNTVAINKFGISKVRIGASPTNIRIVIDSSKFGFPAHNITRTDKGLRINF